MNIRNITKNKLNEYVLTMNEDKYRAKQIFIWLHKKYILSVDEMTNIKSSFR